MKWERDKKKQKIEFVREETKEGGVRGEKRKRNLENKETGPVSIKSAG